MTKIKNTFPSGNLTPSTSIKYMGTIPDCISPEDCTIDKTNLDYLISILLERYCADNAVIDADMSTVDISCILEANPDIELPENITVETLAQYFQDHICNLYTKVSDLNTKVNNINGIICMNDVVTTEENSSVVIDSLFNDVILELSGTAILEILTDPINGVATVSSNSITYVPDEDFNGNDSIVYQVTKGDYSCTGKIKINVTAVVDEETISDIVISQLVTLLQSNEYWDIGIPIGTKMAVSGVNLVDFTLTGGSWGLGKADTKWYKWAICNGNNSTENHKQATLRGFDINDSDYDASAEAGGSDSLTLTASNLPAHKHTYDWILTHDVDGRTIYEGLHNTNIPTSSGEYAKTVTELDAQSGSNNGDNAQCYYEVNTGNATDNIDGEGEVSNDVIDIRNAYTTIVIIQKIA